MIWKAVNFQARGPEKLQIHFAWPYFESNSVVYGIIVQLECILQCVCVCVDLYRL